MAETDNGPPDAGVWDRFRWVREYVMSQTKASAVVLFEAEARGRWLEAERERLIEQSTGVIAVQRAELERLRARVGKLEGVVGGEA